MKWGNDLFWLALSNDDLSVAAAAPMCQQGILHISGTSYPWQIGRIDGETWC